MHQTRPKSTSTPLISCESNIQGPLQIVCYPLPFPRAFVASISKCTKAVDTTMNANQKPSYDIIHGSAGVFNGVSKIENPRAEENRKTRSSDFQLKYYE